MSELAALVAMLEWRGIITTDPAAADECCGLPRDEDGFCTYRPGHLIYVQVAEESGAGGANDQMPVTIPAHLAAAFIRAMRPLALPMDTVTEEGANDGMFAEAVRDLPPPADALDDLAAAHGHFAAFENNTNHGDFVCGCGLPWSTGVGCQFVQGLRVALAHRGADR